MSEQKVACKFSGEKKLVYLGEESDDRSIYVVDFFYHDKEEYESEQFYIISNEKCLEEILDEFANSCDALYAYAYTKIGKER